MSVDPTAHRMPATLEGYEWAKARFKTVLPVVSDGPLIERTIAITGVDPDRAAAAIGAIVQRLASPVLMSDLAKETGFRRSLDSVRELRRNHAGFREALESDAAAYVSRVVRRGDLALAPADARQLSEEYLEYEVATYHCLAERGYLADVYVGRELSVLSKFINGEFGHILSPIERRIFISLNPGGAS